MQLCYIETRSKIQIQKLNVQLKNKINKNVYINKFIFFQFKIFI